MRITALLCIVTGLVNLIFATSACGQINDPRDPARLAEAFLRSQLADAITFRPTVISETQLAWQQNTGLPMPQAALDALNAFLDRTQVSLQRQIAMAVQYGGNATNHVIPFFGTMANAPSPIVANVNAIYYVPDSRGKVYVPDTNDPFSQSFGVVAKSAANGEFDINLAIGLPPAAVVEALVNPIDPFSVTNISFEIIPLTQGTSWVTSGLTQFHFAPYAPPNVVPGIETSNNALPGSSQTKPAALASWILAGAPMQCTIDQSGVKTTFYGIASIRNLALAPPAIDALPVPTPPDLANYIRDSAAAITLGKALYWDIQVSSPNTVSCATCHHQAGIDRRTPAPITGSVLNGNTADPDYAVHGSFGVPSKTFGGLSTTTINGVKTLSDQPLSAAGPLQITGRNSPSTVNAIYNDRQFWDGRADRYFNGVNPFGKNDPSARVYKVVGTTAQPVSILIDNASMASQAVGPVNSSVEMAWAGRTFVDVARKLLPKKPLALQQVAVDDSVLGNGVLNGQTYNSLIEKAFRPEWWNYSKTITINKKAYTIKELNMALYFGLAVQMYESTLVSSAATTPYDRWKNGDPNALTPAQLDGLELFTTSATCIVCHGGPAFTTATAANVRALGGFELMPFPNLPTFQGNYDIGFYNLGVSPDGGPPSSKRSADLGLDAKTPTGRPLSYVDQAGATPSGVIGSFKTPTMRNVQFTAPFMHNGRFGTLAEVVDFYLNPGVTGNLLNKGLHPEIGLAVVPNPVSDPAKIADFLRALTDSRVTYQMAPFDHPSLPFPDSSGSGQLVPGLPAVGRNGSATPLVE